MSFMKIMTFVLLLCGLFLFSGISVREYVSDVAKKVFRIDVAAPSTLAGKIKAAKKQKKKRGIRGMVQYAQNTLRLMGRDKAFILVAELSVLGVCAGVVLALIFGNLFLIPVLGAACFLLPFAYIFFLESGFKRKVSRELEVTLSVITNAYLRSGDIIRAVKENLPNIKRPIYTLFARFVASYEVAGKPPREALLDMQGQIGNKVFDEWAAQAALCQADQSLIPLLLPIVEKLSNERQIQADLKSMMYDSTKEFTMMAILFVCIPLLLYFLKKDWLNILFFTGPGKIVIALDLAVLLIGTYKAVRATRPVEYN
jgi:Flp pilus assembly protein TadB